MNTYENRTIDLTKEKEESAKKKYNTPSVKEYGSISELVQGHGHTGFDGGALDDVSGSH
jgi:hypothetical protein